MGIKNIQGDLQVNGSSVVTENTIKDTKDGLAALQALVSSLKLSSMGGATATSDSLTQVCNINNVPYGHTYIGIFNIQAKKNDTNSNVTLTQTIPIYVPTPDELNGNSFSHQYNIWSEKANSMNVSYLHVECMSYREDTQTCTVRCSGWNADDNYVYSVSATKFTLL